MLHRRSIENLLNLSVPYLVRETTQSMVMPELQLWPPDFTTEYKGSMGQRNKKFRIKKKLVFPFTNICCY